MQDFSNHLVHFSLHFWVQHTQDSINNWYIKNIFLFFDNLLHSDVHRNMEEEIYLLIYQNFKLMGHVTPLNVLKWQYW